MSPSARVKHENIYNVGHLISGLVVSRLFVYYCYFGLHLLWEYLNSILCYMLAGC